MSENLTPRFNTNLVSFLFSRAKTREVGAQTKTVGITLMEGKTTKRKAPPQIQHSKAPVIVKTEPKVSDTSSTETAHENNKILLISGLVLAAFVLSHAFSS